MTIPPQLAIIIQHHSRRSVLRLQGELDAANQDCLRRAIRTVLGHHSPQILVLDLLELGFTDCAGLGAMVWAHKHLAEQGRELVLTGIQPLTRRLLGLTGLDTLARQHPEDPGQPGQEPIPAARRHERNRALQTQGRAAGGHSRTPKWSRSGNTWPGSLRTCSERTFAAIAEVCHARGCPLITDEAWVLDYLRSGIQAGMVVPDPADTTPRQRSCHARVGLGQISDALQVCAHSLNGDHYGGQPEGP